MHQHDSNRVIFFPKEDMAGGLQLLKGEYILRDEIKHNYDDVNEVLELYNLKKYFDNELYLKSWTNDEINDFKEKAREYDKIVGNFFSSINNENIFAIYEQTLHDYIHSFWEIINNYSVFKKISKLSFSKILENEQYLIGEILTHKKIVNYYDNELKNFLLNHSQSAEILLSVYEVEDVFKQNKMIIPKSLSVEDKEVIVLKYLDSGSINLNYIGLIESAKNRNEFKISDETKLKAKRLHKSETDNFFARNSGISHGVSICFAEKASKIKDGYIDDNHEVHYTYSVDFVRKNSHPYQLFQNFKFLFEYTDNQSRINLVSKKSQLGLFENIMGTHSKNHYRTNIGFSLSEMTSQSQMFSYNKVIKNLDTSLENILHFAFTKAFQERYCFADNAKFLAPSPTISYIEKVRSLAPEFESILKQFKLYVENGEIDFELLQISSSPSTIKNIPSLNKNKYIYFNDDNKEMVACSFLFFSDQSLLAYVEPFKEKEYHSFFDLLENEQVSFSNYEDYQIQKLNYLIENEFINVDDKGFIQITNPTRLFIFNDLHKNEFASFYHFPKAFQKEAIQMENEDIISFESSLFSKIEQSYFNYFLNKSEFTNGLDLRNSYVHGTQASPDDVKKHEHAYFTYLKLVVLALLKIDDDLQISKKIDNEK